MPFASVEASALHTSAVTRTGQIINEMIKSGKYKILFDALKGFRNGVVYGARIRAPHALVLNLVWSRASYPVMLRRIFEATRNHSLLLGISSFTFSLLRSILCRLQGKARPWHVAFAGFLVGFCFWGEQNPITVQMSMYILSRIVSAGLFVLADKYGWKIPPGSFRIYQGILWMILMPLFVYSSDTLQSTMRTSMKYIYQDNEKYTSWYDLFCVNSEAGF